jgi:FixJ family two-component response regulator
MAVHLRTVLVVEDDESMRAAMDRLLGVAGFAHGMYESAELLLADELAGEAVCVVSDLRLPGLSGLELLAEMRARGSRVPLILITAHDAPGLREDAIRRGAAAYLVKPFNGTALLDALNTVVGSAGPH